MALEGLKLKAAQRRQAAWDKAMAGPATYPDGRESWDRKDAERQYREDEWEAYRRQAQLEREAKTAARRAAESLVRDKTCQVCGRDILARTGVIAHHGYERPGDGWQTASCFGARALPYEQAHDRLDAAILRVRGILKEAERTLRSLLQDPPASLTYERRVPGAASDGYDRRTGCRTYPQETVTVERPADFSEATIDQYEFGGYEITTGEEKRTYRRLLRSARARQESRVRGLKGDLAFLTARRKAWKAPQA